MFRRGFKTWSEQTSERIRRKLGLSPEAPLDLEALANLMGVIIVTPGELGELDAEVRRRLLNESADDWSALTVTDGKNFLIVLNSAHARTRRNSDLAHELAHILLEHEPSKMFMSSQSEVAIRTHDASQEEEAAWFAGALLLPREALLRIRRERLTDEDACVRYQVSKAMLRYRLNMTGVDVQLSRGFRRRR